MKLSDRTGTESPPPALRKISLNYGGDIVGFEQQPATLVETFAKTVADFPDNKIVHIGPDGSETVCTYTELWQEATSILGGFRKIGLQAGAPIILQCDLSRDFIPAFWGAILGGFIPIPVAIPTDYDQDNASVLKLRSAWDLLVQPMFVASQSQHQKLRGLERFPEMKGFRSVSLDTLRTNEPDDLVQMPNGETLAVIMLTSGSTGVPKGVMLSHRNLMARSVGSVQMNGFSSEDVSLSWMPLDHVASLIYFHLRDIFTGCTQIHVAPAFILQNPLRWLDLIHRFRATVTFAPNFAFGLVNERAREIGRRHWDFSCVRHLLNGGEAVVPRTARTFLQLLAQHSLRQDAMRPAWGMSETSSGVTYGDRFRLNLTSDSDQFAEVGLPIPGSCIRIVNEIDEPINEGEIGRLQFKGLTLMSGYYNIPEMNGEVFTPDGWFKTGDLGFLRDGRLTITGREKNIIIINGVNYYSHDIESVVEQISGIELSYVAACAVRPPGAEAEQLAIFFSCAEQGSNPLAELLTQIRARVAQQNGIKPDYLIALGKSEIPKTEIGKIQHAKLKARFEAGDFKSILDQVEKVLAEHRKQHAPQNDLQSKLASIWCEVLGVSEVGRNESFFAAGGASLAANRVISRTREQLNVELPLSMLFSQDATLEKVAEFIAHHEKTSAAGIAPFPRTEPIPLSFAQQRIWIAEQMNPGTAQFNVARALWLRGQVNGAALEKALNAIVQRHEILRTTFSFKGGRPVQRVESALALVVRNIDLRHENDAERTALELSAAELKEPFDLTKTPLFRATLLRVAESRSMLTLCFHQVVIDGWSVGVLLEDLRTAYEACLTNSPAPLETLNIQYADFAAWQRAQSVEERANHVAYWSHQLAGAVPRLDWIPAKAVTAQAATERLLISKELLKKVKAFNQRENVTLFMTLLTTYKALLRSRNSVDDISVGTAVSGRTHTDTEDLIGFFVNTVVIRNTLPAGLTFREFLTDIRKTSLEAFANADVPFESLVEHLRPSRSEGTPFFQAWFSFMDSMADFEMGGLSVTPIHIPPPEAQFDLSLFIVERAEEVDCFFEYKTGLITSDDIQHFMHSYEALLSQGVEAPQLKLSELFNGVAVPSPEPENFKTIHEWFEHQASRTPQAVAVTCGENFITYGNLNRRANQLARVLQKRGVGPESLVGVALERSREMLISILAVLKAGGAYVPLDPSYPTERLALMLNEINAPVLVTSQLAKEELPVTASSIICIDSDWESISAEADSDLEPTSASDNAAYVIFTSGSTGKPKGVVVTQGNLVQSNKARFTYYEEPIRAYVMISSFSFDSSVAGIFWTLCSGGNLVLPEQGLHQDPSELIRAIQKNRATHFLGLPSLYKLLLQQASPEAISTLRTVIVAGESCSAEVVEQHGKALPHARLCNEYGPTEATVWSSVARLRVGEKVTIGQAIPGTQVYILDESKAPVRQGEAGEVYVGGPTVARGYLNRPDVTSARFVPDHLSGQAGARLYRTGDLARCLPSGDFEFLGRIDHQVKIRGFRIELEEIETVVKEFAGIRDVVVNAFQPREDGEKVLVAYVVGDKAAAAELRQFLKQRLPEYMVPSAVMFLDRMPLMPNGKVDRSALPAPIEEAGSGEAYVAPRTPSEEEISAIWQELLNKERIGIYENFFELGGHSLLAIQAMARVREQFQLEIPLKHIFEAPTIAGLAERVFDLLMAGDQITEINNPSISG